MNDFSSDVDLGGDAPSNNIVPFTRGLEGISKMIDDRNKLIKFYFKEDVYKDFLLAERLQDIADADNQTKSSTSESINLDKQEVDKTQNYFRRFSNFLNPGDLPQPDLDPLIFADDVTLEGPEKGDDDGDDEPQGGSLLDRLGDVLGLNKKNNPGSGTTTKSAYGNVIKPQSSMLGGGMGAAGGLGNLNVSSNLLTPPSDRPQVQSLKESGFEEGMEKNISDEFDADFGIDEKMKKALGLAMASPLQAVAGGLMSLLAKTPVKSNEQKQDLNKSLSFISNAFNVPKATLENVPDDPAVLQEGVNNSRPTKASETSGATSGSDMSGNKKQWWNPFSWFKNDDSPTPTNGQGGSGPMFTGSAITNMMTNNTMTANAHGDSTSTSSVSPTTIASNLFTNNMGDSSTQNTEETEFGDSNKSIFQTLFGGATNLASNVITGSDGHVHAIEISQAESPIQDKKPDLMSLTTSLESELMQRKEDQTTSITSSFASATAEAAQPPALATKSGTSTLNSGSNRAGMEESDSPFFEVFSATSQYA